MLLSCTRDLQFTLSFQINHFGDITQHKNIADTLMPTISSNQKLLSACTAKK